jgi:hypothetical protein
VNSAGRFDGLPTTREVESRIGNSCSRPVAA